MDRKGPFGLWAGMRSSDFEQTLEKIGQYKFKVMAVPKPHSAFDMYAVQVTPSAGLSWIKALGKSIDTSGYGLELKEAFDAMEHKLSSTYGKCSRSDFLFQDSIWHEPRDWMQSLISKERVLVSEWSAKTGASLTDSLSAIHLVLGVYDISSGCIAIEYSFDNYEAAMAEIAALEDDAL